jgi:16S rRNA (guanine966-N2)-methyltransferase
MRIIGGKYRGGKLERPPESITRPTTDRIREAIFNIICHSHDFSLPGSVVLDAFAGSGALGIEALSRGAEHAYFVEKHPAALQVLRQNIAKFQLQEFSQVFAHDINKIPETQKPVDLVFMDPPYQHHLEMPTLQLLQERGWIKPSTKIIIETSKNDSLSFNENFFSIKTLRNYGTITIYIVMPSQ